ncbi:thioesterase II family protein [Aliikangiella maris]|uniref:Alpha/beta fold hydrolase n=2 Tax=Aliikangiella maris TaxID=3162458 RepID=A0ABV2BUA4_9GAMM
MSDKKLKLFLVPFAGSAAMSAYSSWQPHLSNFDVKLYDYPGHGKRMNEPLSANIAETAQDLLDFIQSQLTDDNESYIMYAHSMGCLVLFEMFKRLSDSALTPPAQVFLSGRNPPHYQYRDKILHVLEDKEFLQEIKRIGGTPKEFFNWPELVNLFLPILKNDYRICEQYQFAPASEKLTDLTFFYSDNDYMVTKAKVKEWGDYVKGDFRLLEFEGDHFFIYEYVEEICKLIRQSVIASSIE